MKGVVEVINAEQSPEAAPAAQPQEEAFLSIEHVSKSYTRKVRKTVEHLDVLKDISWSANKREVVTIIGPSGCGKSTLLSSIAGLNSYDSGRIVLDGHAISGPGLDRAVVFQHASLLPWRTVERNVAYGLQLRRQLGKREIAERVEHAISLVGLGGFEHHYPHQISGGMQQRVNLARALVVEPKLLLMDEPYGALDALTKETLQDELAGVIDQFEGTTVFVTHDINEAVFLADKVVVLSARPGRVVAVIPVNLPRPRSRSVVQTPEFEALTQELRSLLRDQPEDRAVA